MVYANWYAYAIGNSPDEDEEPLVQEPDDLDGDSEVHSGDWGSDEDS